MRTFKDLLKKKRADDDFGALYERECHVCRYTVRIFERLEERRTEPIQLAEALGVSVDALTELKEAEYCRPRLVIALCRHLGLEAPESCPRLG